MADPESVSHAFATPALDHNCSDLTLPQISVGSHGTVWDLQVLLYRGGAGTRIDHASKAIAEGRLGEPLPERFALVQALHEIFQADIVRGVSRRSLIARRDYIRNFFSWSDDHAITISIETAEHAFLEWSDFLWHRSHIQKKIKKDSAYHGASYVSNALARALNQNAVEQHFEGRALMRKTRLRRSRKGTPNADKSNQQDLARFGRFLVSLCEDLTAEAIRGPMPFTITLPNGASRHWPRSMRRLDDVKHPEADWYIDARRALGRDQHVSGNRHRAALVNLRIEAELGLFVSQTGMNATQAQNLKREPYRWQSVDDEALVYRVHKGRRQGQAVFRVFKAYREWFRTYLEWLDALQLKDDRLFPFVEAVRIIAPKHAYRNASALRQLCRDAGVPHYSYRSLRKSRQNWLLRLTGDPDLTATMGAHAKQTLLRVYEEPHHQSAAARISRHHQQFDPTLAPGPGRCADPAHAPSRESDAPPMAPQPDCISPEGCLFCIHHRDVIDFDYAWKLVSHAECKALERDHYERPMRNADPHPADEVVDRINAKLDAIASYSREAKHWVTEARERAWSGRYHPRWDGFIKLWEALN